jgi:hypothetical protein
MTDPLAMRPDMTPAEREHVRELRRADEAERTRRALAHAAQHAKDHPDDVPPEPLFIPI